MDADVGVAVFARLPVEGKVKTRLAATVGHPAACRFYRACAERALHEIATWEGARTTLFFSDASEAEGIYCWVDSLGISGRCDTAAQVQSPDLGARMHAALAHCLAREGCSRAIVAGTDIPALSSAHLAAAAAALGGEGGGGADVVVGPAADGGYYLLGVRGRCPEALFQGVPWSSSTTLKEQVARAEALGLRVAPLNTLPTLRDVDEESDLREWLGTADPLHSVYEAASACVAGAM